MSIKRTAAEAIVFAIGLLRGSHAPKTKNPSIFILRNNGIGDVLLATPLFEALRQHFPESRISAGVGSWSRDILLGNPNLTDIITIDAPWCNPVNAKGTKEQFSYILNSDQVAKLSREKFDIGIDVLGSPQGSLLLLRAGIPYRLGVRGYAGGHSGASAFVDFNGDEHVARFALHFAELLGAKELPPARPQIFLTGAEIAQAEAIWGASRQKLLVSPGAGYEAKSWPIANFAQLCTELAADAKIVLVGSSSDAKKGEVIAEAVPGVENLIGKASLRISAALAATADTVICNSSMMMHCAAAFRTKCLILLGPDIESANEHEKLWGYPNSESLIAGKSREHPEIFSALEAVELVQRMLNTTHDSAAS